MSYQEDDLTNALIQYYENKNLTLVQIIEPEAFYRDYGMRGCPDLYVVFHDTYHSFTEAHLIEVKSEPAVRGATGANEIIRQFNKMRRYFYSSEERSPPVPEFDFDEIILIFELSFIPSVYKNLVQQMAVGERRMLHKVLIC